MFRRGRRCLAITLAVAALALPAAPAAAAGPSDAGSTWTVGMELWAGLGRIGDWLRMTFLADGTSHIDPNGYTSHIDPNGLNANPDGTLYIDPNGLQGATSDHTPFIDPNG